jgi:hypothetical protein
MLWVVSCKKSFGLPVVVCFIFQEKVITILCLGTISRFFVHIEKKEEGKNFDLNISGPLTTVEVEVKIEKCFHPCYRKEESRKLENKMKYSRQKKKFSWKKFFFDFF